MAMCRAELSMPHGIEAGVVEMCFYPRLRQHDDMPRLKGAAVAPSFVISARGMAQLGNSVFISISLMSFGLYLYEYL